MCGKDGFLILFAATATSFVRYRAATLQQPSTQTLRGWNNTKAAETIDRTKMCLHCVYFVLLGGRQFGTRQKPGHTSGNGGTGQN